MRQLQYTQFVTRRQTGKRKKTTPITLSNRAVRRGGWWGLASNVRRVIPRKDVAEAPGPDLVFVLASHDFGTNLSY